MTHCVLCETTGGELLWRDDKVRVVAVDETDYPGFCRVIWNPHMTEFSELEAGAREYLIEIVAQVERIIRQVMQPVKMNLASLGNQVPHLHWHLIPRYADDAHFPAPIWGPRARTTAEAVLQLRRSHALGLREAIISGLAHQPHLTDDLL
ncbi:histidine triad protein [Mycoavidus cysteinexigens]|uniref:Histidine triad protein n=1 Tax=Mycoavidus cysteinexigens TaxID=1553431 RepID=A0A2Z6EU23_9BURK|nr:HIT family protein [Mycoavidus cysteinexigens]BBE08933.1 histidine triad protein [Mycoavidus cysteinexigens]GAM52344.1 diadenosine tetraphosphate (Ap4A) hydrolase and other HIT family hydrolases [bacterium endosymbiont of Mortierella elongata FMR23-6]GLR01223.1 HIT family protein [Mycoavidus cysteinexigens]